MMATKIKILHLVSGDLWGGAEAQAATLLSQLKRVEDMEVTAIVLNRGRLATELAAMGVRIDILEESKIGPFRLLYKVWRTLRKNKIDILHSHRYKENIIGSIAAKLSGIPVILRTVHGLNEHFAGLKRSKMVFYESLEYVISLFLVDRLIAVSLDIGRLLTRRYNSRKIEVIHNSIDLSRIKALKNPTVTRQELSIKEDAIVIGSAGRLVKVKGLDLLLQASALIKKSIPNLKVLIAGEGPEKQSLQSLAGSIGLDNDIIFAGHRDDVYDLIQAMNVFVLPSYSEGIPLAMLEAMALGIPVVATEVGGIPEVITDGINGYLIRSRKPELVAAKCLLLLNNIDLRNRLTHNAKEKIKNAFSVDVQVSKISRLYRCLIADSR